MIYHVEMLRIREFCLNNTSVLCFVCSVGDGVEMLGEGICRKGWKQVNPGMTSMGSVLDTSQKRTTNILEHVLVFPKQVAANDRCHRTLSSGFE